MSYYTKGSLELFSKHFSKETLIDFLKKNNEKDYENEHCVLWFTFQNDNQYVYCSIKKEDLVSKRITLEIGSDRTGNEIPFQLAREVIQKFIDYFDDLAIISDTFIAFDLKSLIQHKYLFEYTFTDAYVYDSISLSPSYYDRYATVNLWFEIEDKIMLDTILDNQNRKFKDSTYRIYSEKIEKRVFKKEFANNLLKEYEVHIRGFHCIFYLDDFSEEDFNAIIEFCKENNLNYIEISTQYFFKGNDRDIVLKGRRIFY